MNVLVQRKVAAVTDEMASRKSSFEDRSRVQRHSLKLPLLPTTTIGSFPQTPAIRQARAAYKRGELRALEYLERMRAETATVVRKQEELGLDVLVHGEVERNDMVECFAERLWGYALMEGGWVQNYGSQLEHACEVIPAERLWVNPDCGLKTRGWPETEAALANMIAAARTLRQKLEAQRNEATLA